MVCESAELREKVPIALLSNPNMVAVADEYISRSFNRHLEDIKADRLYRSSVLELRVRAVDEKIMGVKTWLWPQRSYRGDGGAADWAQLREMVAQLMGRVHRTFDILDVNHEYVQCSG